jgi:hypothetical protein
VTSTLKGRGYNAFTIKRGENLKTRFFAEFILRRFYRLRAQNDRERRARDNERGGGAHENDKIYVGTGRVMKAKRRLLLRTVAVAAVVIVSLVGVAAYAHNKLVAVSGPPALDYESMTTVQQQAWAVASQVVGSSKAAQEQFVGQLLDLYNRVKGHDLVIFCEPGGWGKKPMETDMQAHSWLAGIESVLTGLGYSYTEVEDIRTETGLPGTLFELKEQLTHYPDKGKELAAKIDFLTQNISGLKVIITGQSNGAGLAGEVTNRLQANPNVFSIQVGIPFWHRVLQNSRSLIINENGIGPDTLTQKDIFDILKNNWVQLFIINKVPSFTPYDWLITRAVLIFGPYNLGLGMEAPGHDYMWDYPGVGPVIQAFLERNFSTE